MTTTASTEELFDCRTAFAEALSELAQENPRVVAVCNDSVGSSNLVGFAKAFPNRIVNVGIAEQDMVGVAAGLANAGFVPYVCGAAPFLTGRALEQIKVDIAYSAAHVVLCGMSPGVAYGELGPTHHALEDLSWLRAIADLNIATPADPDQTKAAVRWALQNDVPTYIRVPRTKVPSLGEVPGSPIAALELRQGHDIALLALGPMASAARSAADRLANQGVRARVVVFNSLRPLDSVAIARAAFETRAIVTIEEGTTTGGFGAAVAQWCAENHPIPMRIIGARERFAPTGSAEYLLAHFHLDPEGIATAALEIFNAVNHAPAPHSTPNDSSASSASTYGGDQR